MTNDIVEGHLFSLCCNFIFIIEHKKYPNIIFIFNILKMSIYAKTTQLIKMLLDIIYYKVVYKVNFNHTTSLAL